MVRWMIGGRPGDALVTKDRAVWTVLIGLLVIQAGTAPGAGAFESGTYLGQSLRLRRALDPQETSPPPERRKLVLRGDLIVGTSRNFRDDGTGRKDREADYSYVPFTKADYDEMIAAGINYFTARHDGHRHSLWVQPAHLLADVHVGHTRVSARPQERAWPDLRRSPDARRRENRALPPRGRLLRRRARRQGLRPEWLRAGLLDDAGWQDIGAETVERDAVDLRR